MKHWIKYMYTSKYIYQINAIQILKITGLYILICYGLFMFIDHINRLIWKDNSCNYTLTYLYFKTVFQPIYNVNTKHQEVTWILWFRYISSSKFQTFKGFRQ